jgi:hypothetical protein
MADAGSWQVHAQMTVNNDSDAGERLLLTTINAARSGPGVNIVFTSSNATTGSISGSTSSETRIVDGTRYRRDPNSGEWTVSDASDASPGLTVDVAVVEQIDVSTTSINVTELEGEEVFHVTGTVPGADAAVTAEVFAGVGDHLVRKIRLEGSAPPSNFGGLLPLSDTLLPQIVEAYYLEYGRPIEVHVPPAIEEAENAETRTYLSTINPYTMVVPGGLRDAPRTEFGGEAFSGTGGEMLFIIEEYLDVETAYVGELAGKAPNAETYARRFEIEIEKSEVYEIVSNEAFITDSGLEARLIRFTESDGDIQWAHLSYLHADDFGFGATYGAFTGRYNEIEDAIFEAFRSFEIVD